VTLPARTHTRMQSPSAFPYVERKGRWKARRLSHTRIGVGQIKKNTSKVPKHTQRAELGQCADCVSYAESIHTHPPDSSEQGPPRLGRRQQVQVPRASPTHTAAYDLTCLRDERGTPHRLSGRTTQAKGDRGCWFCRRVDSKCKSLSVCGVCRGRAH